MTKTIEKSSFNIDKVNYDYLKRIPEKRRSLVDIMFIKMLERKRPELKS